MLIGLFYFSYHYFFLVSDPVWQTKLAIRRFFDCTLNTFVSYRIVLPLPSSRRRRILLLVGRVSSQFVSKVAFFILSHSAAG